MRAEGRRQRTEGRGQNYTPIQGLVALNGKIYGRDRSLYNLLLITYYLLLITYYLLLITYNLLLITYYLLLVMTSLTRYSLFSKKVQLDPVANEPQQRVISGKTLLDHFRNLSINAETKGVAKT
jgi:hypothetical protein